MSERREVGRLVPEEGAVMCEKKGGDVRRLYTASLPYRARRVTDFVAGREGKMVKRSEGTKRRGRRSGDTKGQRDTEGALEIRRTVNGER